MPDSHIDISIELNSRQLDLRVPTDVTLTRLIHLVSQVLQEHHITMPRQWRLDLQDKQINLGSHDTLNDFPIGDGDLLTVVVEPERAHP